MTQEDKELLLKDLCARLPYGLKVYYNNGQLTGNSVIEDLYRVTNKFRSEVAVIEDEYGLCGMSLDNIKPYLFPMSSMTGEQKKEMCSFDPFQTEETKTLGQWAFHLVDFYNKYHFDYRGLIEKGLAIDATGLSVY